jgi:hypothetical protein
MILIPVWKQGYVVRGHHHLRQLHPVLWVKNVVLTEALAAVAEPVRTAVMITTAVVRMVGVAGVGLVITSAARFKFFCSKPRMDELHST